MSFKMILKRYYSGPECYIKRKRVCPEGSSVNSIKGTLCFMLMIPSSSDKSWRIP